MRMVHRTRSVVVQNLFSRLQSVCCYMSHDGQRGEDLCSVNEREPSLSGRPHQRTSCQVRIRLVNRQHASRRTRIVWFASHLERIKCDKILTSVRALHTMRPVSLGASGIGRGRWGDRHSRSIRDLWWIANSTGILARPIQ